MPCQIENLLVAYLTDSGGGMDVIAGENSLGYIGTNAEEGFECFLAWGSELEFSSGWDARKITLTR
jgi:hypothetical protein